MITWVYDEIGCPGVILDDFCIRSLAGHTVGWVFGLSVFSLKGEHIGWCEDGVFYDIENKVIGVIPDAPGMPVDMPGLAPEPALPAFSKRPYVPSLRARSARPRAYGWSAHGLAAYFAPNRVPAAAVAYHPRAAMRDQATRFSQS